MLSRAVPLSLVVATACVAPPDTALQATAMVVTTAEPTRWALVQADAEQWRLIDAESGEVLETWSHSPHRAPRLMVWCDSGGYSSVDQLVSPDGTRVAHTLFHEPAGGWQTEPDQVAWSWLDGSGMQRFGEVRQCALAAVESRRRAAAVRRERRPPG